VTIRGETWLFVLQRASAALLAVAVTVHLVTIVTAVRGGLSAAEILGRLHGNIAWLVFYAVFVAAVAVHAPIGLRAILQEWAGWRGRSLELFTVLLGLALALAGWRAIGGLFA
jgi:fumarate reductase subunit C